MEGKHLLICLDSGVVRMLRQSLCGASAALEIHRQPTAPHHIETILLRQTDFARRKKSFLKTFQANICSAVLFSFFAHLLNSLSIEKFSGSDANTTTWQHNDGRWEAEANWESFIAPEIPILHFFFFIKVYQFLFNLSTLSPSPPKSKRNFPSRDWSEVIWSQMARAVVVFAARVLGKYLQSNSGKI